ncbi:bacillithiol system redox-active protein YtxJ [Flavobacterium agrisoli]|uniref:Bacillithiol system redox-active protein YtxJ n=1 Tax=Flavobacterium agrisoli TaxID=2793066 RepID=A0A934UI12_9FLAO|nr:bacillithiol system redox-active protein YtxJ [Flavobacterium agrisoli]MBK0368342.1 bacillithiol system redox-active protein YtxJ [Flavobacterium agrisoli]
MSFFSSLFGNSDSENSNESKINWIPLINLSQLDDIENISNVKPILIFKHSTRCSISRMALKQFEREYDLDESVDAFFLDLLEHRDISNEIAARFNVIHQSPQILLIQNKKAVYNASHSDINAENLKTKIL